MAQQQLMYAWLKESDFGNAGAVDATIAQLTEEMQGQKVERILKFKLMSGPAAGQLRQLSLYGDNWNHLVQHDSESDHWNGLDISIERVKVKDKWNKVIRVQ